LLVNVSNDGWFGDFGEPRLHLIYAKLRSVELGLPQVPVTNTGYSAVIQPSGDLIFESGYGERIAVVVPAPIPSRRPLSLVARWGTGSAP
jgi:apolipoprotein N-acyltransferase